MPDQLSATFGALADPTRRAILARLAAGETSVSKLAEPFAISLPAVFKHLKVLKDRGRLKSGLRADVNLIDFDRLRLHQPEVLHDLPARARSGAEQARLHF